MSRKVIIDTDLGTDDAFALILLLESDVEIVAITCVHGNTSVENVYNNVKRILKLCNREDIPVYLGSSEPLVYNTENPDYFHGKDGFGDLVAYDQKIIQANYSYNAVSVINKLVLENPFEIILICLGPLTNIALATKICKSFREYLKLIYIMGGNYKGIGNTTSAAEFNFYMDPEAAYIVLEFLKCSILILPWESCLDQPISFDWRYTVLGQAKHPTISLLNRVDQKIYANEKNWIPCDAYLAALFLHPVIIKKSFTCKISVELHGSKTRAQMVINHVEKNLISNATIVTDIELEEFKSVLLRAFNK